MINLILHQEYSPTILKLAYALDKTRKPEFDNYELSPEILTALDENERYLMFSKIKKEIKGADIKIIYIGPEFYKKNIYYKGKEYMNNNESLTRCIEYEEYLKDFFKTDEKIEAANMVLSCIKGLSIQEAVDFLKHCEMIVERATFYNK